MAGVERGEGALGVLLKDPDAARALRRVVTAADGLAQAVDRARTQDSVLRALLDDPALATDLRDTARSFREVTGRIARGEGMLGALTQPGRRGQLKQATEALAQLGQLADGLGGDAKLGETLADLRQAMADLRAITGRIAAGEGTLGGLIQDPTVYENLAAFLEGAQRSVLLRALIRSAIGRGTPAPGAAPPRAEGPRSRETLVGLPLPGVRLPGRQVVRPLPRLRRVQHDRRGADRRAPRGGGCGRRAPASRGRGARDRARAPGRGVGRGGRPRALGRRRAGSRPRRRRRAGVAGPDRRRSGHRQVHPPPPGLGRARGDGGARPLRVGRGVGRAGEAPGGPARAGGVGAPHPGRDAARDHRGARGGDRAAGAGRRLDPDRLPRRPGIGARQREPGPRVRRAADGARQEPGHRGVPGRARHQGGRAGRPARARAPGRHRALLRGRAPRDLPRPAGREEPLRLDQRDRRLRDDRRRAAGGAESLRHVPGRAPARGGGLA